MKFKKLRTEYHEAICEQLLGRLKSYPNIADVSSRSSVAFAEGIVEKLGYQLCKHPPSGQTIGAKFGELTMEFLDKAFKHLSHLRPGSWVFSVSQERAGIALFDQYMHLVALDELTKQHKELSSIIGSEYIITPDVVVARMPVGDSELNRKEKLLNKRSDIANYTPLLLRNNRKPNAILHASISCKWTIRSDRAQNTRTEALNLIRNRKGNTPHIIAVTAEPLPTRIASIALGTGDIDCVYHIALVELMEVAKASEFFDQYEMLRTLVEGRRLRDISDLVFDLAI